MRYILLCLALTACATPYPDSPRYRECNYEATKATAGGTFYGARGVVAEAYAEAVAHREILDACMAR